MPISPSAALVHGRKLVILSAICYARLRHELHVYLHLLPRIFRPLIWLALPWLAPLVPLACFQLCDNPLKPAVAARIPVLLPQLLVRQYQVFPPMLLRQPTNLSYLLRRVRPR